MYQTWEPEKIYPTLGDLVKNGYKVFDDSWDTHVKEHKKILCDKILRYYWFNQIGCETPDRFIWYINEQLSRIMPYYNQLYASELIKFDPMLNHSITANGRSIENLLKTVKADNTRTNKVLRDFIAENTSYGDSSANTGVKSSDTLDKTVQTVYNKDGTDDSTTTTEENQTTKENQWETTDYIRARDQVETVHGNVTGSLTGKVTGNTDSTKITTENKDIDINVNGTTHDTDTGTVVDDGVGTSKANGTKDWTETKDDKATTNVVTELDENTKSSSRKDYADTPQTQLTGGTGGVSAGDGLPNIRADYLTNVTWDYGNSDHHLDSTVNTDFKDDETKTHTETTSDDKNTTDKNTQTRDLTKDGTSETVTDHTENNTENETAHSTTTTDTVNNTTENTVKTTEIKEDIKDNTTRHQTTDTERDTHAAQVYDDDWTEKGNQDEITHSSRVGTSDTVATAKNTETKSGRENLSENSGSTAISKEDTERTKDTGTTDNTSGFMNIPSSALLEAFRKTFLNIDQKIIDDLRENFLAVF